MGRRQSGKAIAASETPQTLALNRGGAFQTNDARTLTFHPGVEGGAVRVEGHENLKLSENAHSPARLYVS